LVHTCKKNSATADLKIANDCKFKNCKVLNLQMIFDLKIVAEMRQDDGDRRTGHTELHTTN